MSKKKLIPRCQYGTNLRRHSKNPTRINRFDDGGKSMTSKLSKNIYNRIIALPSITNVKNLSKTISSYIKNDDDYVERVLKNSYLGENYNNAFNDIKSNIETSNLKNATGAEELLELPILEDAKSIYLDMPQRFNTFDISKYQPNGARENTVYYKNKLLENAGARILLKAHKENKLNSIEEYSDNMLYGMPYNKTKKGNVQIILPGLGTATSGIGVDKNKGEYVSYYDKWDVGRGKPESKHLIDYFYQ